MESRKAGARTGENPRNAGRRERSRLSQAAAPQGAIRSGWDERKEAVPRRRNADRAWLSDRATRPASGHVRAPLASCLTKRDKPFQEATRQRNESREHPLKNRGHGMYRAERSCRLFETVAHLITDQQARAFPETFRVFSSGSQLASVIAERTTPRHFAT